MKWGNQFLKNFDAGERKVLSLLLLLILIVLVSLNVNYFWKQESQVSSENLEVLESKEQEILKNRNEKFSKNEETINNSKDLEEDEKTEVEVSEIIKFNPDTIKLEGWKDLGFSEKQAQSLINFKKAIGGSFTKESFQSSFVVSEQKFIELEPFMVFSEDQSDLYIPKEFNDSSSVTIEDENMVIDIQVADTTELQKLKGIGPVLSKRIINYRKELGGFSSVNQLSEVYGVEQEWVDKNKSRMTVDPSKIKKININKANFDQLKSHPYISYSLAKAIENYRKYRGEFTTVDDLLKIPDLSEEKVIKLEPYLKFSND